MSYIRVIPRDLFNEANLLKCYGQIYINLERLNLPHVRFEHFNANDPFDVQQDMGDGGLTIDNIDLTVRGKRLTLRRPINSREPWPLLVIGDDDEETPVFNDDGTFSADMLAILTVGGQL